MAKSNGRYPSLSVDTTGTGIVSQAGAVTLLRTAEKVGLSAALSAALAPWRKPLATHDPGKIVLDLAVSVALGGDCLADIAVLREQPAVFGRVASDPTVSRLIATLAADAAKALAAIGRARVAARKVAWNHAGKQAPDHDIDADHPLVIDLDATLVTAHSEKEVVALAVELTAWMKMLALADHPARRWEPKRLRLRLFSIAGRIARHARRTHLRLSAHAPWGELIQTTLIRLAALPAPT